MIRKNKELRIKVENGKLLVILTFIKPSVLINILAIICAGRNLILGICERNHAGPLTVAFLLNAPEVLLSFDDAAAFAVGGCYLPPPRLMLCALVRLWAAELGGFLNETLLSRPSFLNFFASEDTLLRSALPVGANSFAEELAWNSFSFKDCFAEP